MAEFEAAFSGCQREEERRPPSVSVHVTGDCSSTTSSGGTALPWLVMALL